VFPDCRPAFDDDVRVELAPGAQNDPGFDKAIRTDDDVICDFRLWID
jgi:hypothetical protein